MSSFLGRKDLTRGLRNNNPFNLVFTNTPWQGKIPKSQNTDENNHFEQFTSLQYGIRAGIRNIITHVAKGENTIRKLITVYAPIFENNTDKYISDISKKTGIGADAVIKDVDYFFMLSIARAIIEVENGKDSKYILDSDIDSAIDIIGDVNLKGVTVTARKKFKFNYLIIPFLLFFYTVLTVIVTV